MNKKVTIYLMPEAVREIKQKNENNVVEVTIAIDNEDRKVTYIDGKQVCINL